MAKYESSTIYVYSFEDSSSVSSGDISDAINDISTDDVTTGSSLSGDAAEREAHAHQKHRAHQQQQVGGVAITDQQRHGAVAGLLVRLQC